MDEFLANVGVQAMRYAIRSGIALTSSYAIGQCSRLLKSVDDTNIYAELKSLQSLLNMKIKIISPAIDLIEFKSGRGNVFLESALPLTKSLHQQINELGRRVEDAATTEERNHCTGANNRIKETSNRGNLQCIVKDLKCLLEEIYKEIPLLQLAISASGESLSTSLPAGISPSRLLQASTLLIIGDTQYAQDPGRVVQIGPSFTLSIYMLFLGHASTTDHGRNSAISNGNSSHTLPRLAEKVYGLGEKERKPLWQEAIHKARVRLCRSSCPLEREASWAHHLGDGAATDNIGAHFAYHLEITEDLDDGRVHDEGDVCQPHNGFLNTGIKELIPIYQLAKIFYTDTGRLLNIGDGKDGENNPVLLLKRDVGAPMSNGDECNLHCGVPAAVEENASDKGCEDEQADIDRQLSGETYDSIAVPAQRPKPESNIGLTNFPKHLDPEWIAFEVFEEDHVSSSTDSDTEDESDHGDELKPSPQPKILHRLNSLDSTFLSQIKNLSVQPNQGKNPKRPSQPKDVSINSAADTEGFVSRSPFGAITTSLSLIEMMIRLAGLQEFQQASHLSIPDHVLTFFLEETSTTGMAGEAMWRARTATKQRVGFDPYTDAA